MRLLVVVVALTTACGRVAFDDRTTDAAAIQPDALFEPTKIPIGRGGDARFLSVPGDKLDVMYVVFGDNHLVRSDDRGATFHDCGFFPRSINGLAADAARVVTATGDGVWISTDGCATFAKLGSLANYITTVALEGPNILASNSMGLYRWDGVQWSFVPTPLDGMFLNCISVPRGAGQYLIGSNAGIAASSDGVTFALANTGITNLQIERFARAGTTLYAATGDGVYRSTNNGASWTQLLTGFGDELAVDPGDANFIMHASSVGLEGSNNGGVSWTADLRPSSFNHARVQGLVFDPAGSGQLVAATGRGLFKSDAHNMPFQPLGSLDAWTATAFARDGNGAAAEFATTVGIVDMATSAIRDTGGFDFTTANDVISVGASTYAAGRSVSQSTGGGPFTDLYTPDATDGYWMQRIREDAGELFATSYRRALHSNDNGVTWSGPTMPVTYIFALLVIPGTPRQVYVGADNGVYYSSDGGTTFAAAAVVYQTNSLIQLADSSILAGTDFGVYRAPSAGGGFSRISDPALDVRALARNGSTVYAVINDTVQSSTNGGMTFTPVAGFTGHSPFSLWVDPDGSLVVGTLGWGVYRLRP